MIKTILLLRGANYVYPQLPDDLPNCRTVSIRWTGAQWVAWRGDLRGTSRVAACDDTPYARAVASEHNMEVVDNFAVGHIGGL